ncbi:MAG: RNA polymerase sigma factor [Candidatus Humimicrobiia bacterium]
MGIDKDLENSTIYKAKLGDNSAFEEIVKKYQKSIKVFAYAFFRNIDVADDVSQEIFIKVFKKLKKLRDVSNFKKWLFKIARNTCINYYRKSKKHKDLLEFNESISIHNENKEDKFILKEDIKNSFLKLSSVERKAIILVSLIGFSYKETSEILNCPIGTVASRVYRANKKLIKNLS